MFGLTLRTANAAFHPEFGDGSDEVARILRDVADRVEAGDRTGVVRDINGNPVGTFRMTNVGTGELV